MASSHQMAVSLGVVVLLLSASIVHGSGQNDTLSGDGGTTVGEITKIEEFPWQVSLEVNERHYCGGTVLSERWVLTVASCLFLHRDETVVRTSTSTKERGGLTHKVKTNIIHERFNTDAIQDHDIAVLEMEEPFVWTEQLKPIGGLATENPAVGTRVVETGWDRLHKDDPQSDQLRQLTVSIVDWNECKRIYDDKYFYWVTKDKICTSGQKKGDCLPNTGGAVIDEKTKVLVGVLRGWFVPCYYELPFVETSVAALRDWIREKTGV